MRDKRCLLCLTQPLGWLKRGIIPQREFNKDNLFSLEYNVMPFFTFREFGGKREVMRFLCQNKEQAF